MNKLQEWSIFARALRSNSKRAAAALFAAALLIGCASSPTEELDGAEKALLDASWAEECAETSYRTAQKMLDEAKAANEAGDYDEAKRKAEAAMRLAEKARTDADLNKEECERRKNAQNTIEEKLDKKGDNVTVKQADDVKLQTVYFDFNESALTTDGQSSIKFNAKYLDDNPAVKVRIEGHTDERGSTEYNLALSQRRGQGVKRYLQNLGIEGNRMKVVPYGEEKPAAYGSSETDHAKNRRAEFIPY